jgi:predicted ester cyclase
MLSAPKHGAVPVSHIPLATATECWIHETVFEPTCTHRGEFMGIPTTGRDVAGAGMGIYHVVDCRIEEQWIRRRHDLLAQQLGQVQP